MRILLLALYVSASALFASASVTHGGLAARHPAHQDLAARVASSLVSRAEDSKKKCPKRSHKPKGPLSKPKTSSTAAKPKPTNNTNPKPNTNSFTGGGTGLNSVKGACGNPAAQKTSSKTSGPMGSIDYLNCGIDGAGWNPPNIRVENLIAHSLSTALQSPSSPFKACGKYIHLFEKYGAINNIPAIMLASFAIQESSCNPDTVGGGGEQGLMQITNDKCGGAPGGNCRDPEFNIRTGAAFFARTLRDVGGNVPLAIGKYNGWERGLTIQRATAARHSKCCRCQNNLDYIHQFLNGWMQNIDAYQTKMGKYFNLNVCPGH